MTCPDKKPVRAYLTAEEYAAVKKLARGGGLSVSRLLRDLALGRPIKSFEHEDFKLELLKTRSELGRLGGLLKLALAQTNEDFPAQNRRDLLAEIGACQAALKEAVRRL